MKKGKRIIYLVQAIDATIGSDALLPAFQTEGTWTQENEILDEQTKSGRVVDYGNDSENFELTIYAKTGDAGQEAIQTSYDNKKQLKVWRVDLDLNTNGQHDARFAFTIIESIETSEPTDGYVEISVSLPVVGKSQAGELVPLPPELIEAATYDFETMGETGTPAAV